MFKKSVTALALIVLSATSFQVSAGGKNNGCSKLPDYNYARWALRQVVDSDSNGFNLDMWLTLVNRDGTTCVVTMSGSDRGDQWPGSRVISAQKANTANAFSLPGLALSTANLYTAVQPGGSLFGLQHSNPVDAEAAYQGSARYWGRKKDPMVGKRVGGVNVFGGGLAMYDHNGRLVGALGVSGDSSCRDHIVAWKVRDLLKMDNVPAGVDGSGGDNMVMDTIVDPATGQTTSPSGWGHPFCGNGEEAAVSTLHNDHPFGQ